MFVTNVSIILEMKLSLATATLIPNEAYEKKGVKALAQNSVELGSLVLTVVRNVLD